MALFRNWIPKYERNHGEEVSVHALIVVRINANIWTVLNKPFRL
jgi:hypothetical protein